MDLQAEAAVAKEQGLSWRERGPPSAPGEVWRGQQWRAGSERFANRGGCNKEWWAGYYAAKRENRLEAFLAAHPRPR